MGKMWCDRNPVVFFTTIESEVKWRTHVKSTHLRCLCDDAVALAISVRLNWNKLLFLFSSSVEFLLLEFIIIPSAFGRPLTICVSHFITKFIFMNAGPNHKIVWQRDVHRIYFILQYYYLFPERNPERIAMTTVRSDRMKWAIYVWYHWLVFDNSICCHIFVNISTDWQWADALK